jgi:hypothetical protein
MEPYQFVLAQLPSEEVVSMGASFQIGIGIRAMI